MKKILHVLVSVVLSLAGLISAISDCQSDKARKVLSIDHDADLKNRVYQKCKDLFKNERYWLGVYTKGDSKYGEVLNFIDDKRLARTVFLTEEGFKGCYVTQLFYYFIKTSSALDQIHQIQLTPEKRPLAINLCDTSDRSIDDSFFKKTIARTLKLEGGNFNKELEFSGFTPIDETVLGDSLINFIQVKKAELHFIESTKITSNKFLVPRILFNFDKKMLCIGSLKNELGKIELIKNGFALKANHWYQEGDYSSDGWMENITYIDPKGKTKTDTLEICYLIGKEYKYYLREK